MDIAVCIKLVSELRYTDALSENGSERLSGGSLVMNPADAYALECALRVKDAAPDVCITVITMGPDAAENILRQALSMGADKAVHICDSLFAGSDTLATADVLSRALRTLGELDLILCGQKAIDSETGHIGPQLGALLKMDVITNVIEFDVKADKGIGFTAVQDNGTARYEGRLPIILTICNGTEPVRIPTIAGMRQGRSKAIRAISSKDLSIDLPGIDRSPTKVLKLARIEHKKRVDIFETDAGRAVEIIADTIFDKGGARFE